MTYPSSTMRLSHASETRPGNPGFDALLVGEDWVVCYTLLALAGAVVIHLAHTTSQS